MGDGADLNHAIGRIGPHVARHADNVAGGVFNEDQRDPIQFFARADKPVTKGIGIGKSALREISEQYIYALAAKGVPEPCEVFFAIERLGRDVTTLQHHRLRCRTSLKITQIAHSLPHFSGRRIRASEAG